MNIAAYARISHEEVGKLYKEDLSNSIENQLEYIRDYTGKMSQRIKEVYIDDGYSGTDFNRPAIKRLFEDIEQGVIDCVVVKDLSRLGRNYVMTGYFIEHYFPNKNVRFISINDNIDTWEKDDEMLVFRNVFNDWYAKDISKKIRSAKYSRAVSGKRINNVAPYGYTTVAGDNSFKLMVNEGQAEIVRMIFNLYAKGGSVREICEQLYQKGILTPRFSKKYKVVYFKDIDKNKLVVEFNNRLNDLNKMCLWSPKTVYDILKREEYMGNTVSLRRKRISYKNHKEINNSQDKIIRFKNTHEAIVGEDIWRRVDRRMKSKEI